MLNFNVGRTLKNPVLILASVLVLIGLAALNVVRNGHTALLGLGYPWYSNPAFANPAESSYFQNGYSQSYPFQPMSSPRLMYIPFPEDHVNSIAEPALLAGAGGLQYSQQDPAPSAISYSPKAEPAAVPSNYPERLRMSENFGQAPVNFHL
jgi:hypothetical protein